MFGQVRTYSWLSPPRKGPPHARCRRHPSGTRRVCHPADCVAGSRPLRAGYRSPGPNRKSRHRRTGDGSLRLIEWNRPQRSARVCIDQVPRCGPASVRMTAALTMRPLAYRARTHFLALPRSSVYLRFPRSGRVRERSQTAKTQNRSGDDAPMVGACAEVEPFVDSLRRIALPLGLFIPGRRIAP